MTYVEPADRPDLDVDREAWALLLEGAESHVEDAVDEDGEWSEADWTWITDRALDLIQHLRATHT